MNTRTIRIKEETHKTSRERFLKELNASFTALKSTPEWEKEKNERAQWDNTLSDDESDDR